ncbi:MAG: hypothetical protein DMG44_19010 [Acidobacteria bacterium]|nr:MAG: hypothetical protein DMG44_19010 [Acidobacteriota bacterium]
MESKKFAQHGMLVVVRSLVSDRRCLLTLMLALLMPMFARGESQPLTIAELFGFPSTNTDGTTPHTPVIQASDGNLYGTTTLGGNDGSGCVHGCAGTVFKLTLQGQITVLYTFASPYANGRTPRGGLVEGGDGYLYGTTISGGLSNYGVVFKISKTGQFQKLHDFCATFPCTEGTNPVGSLILGTDGNFYGTTSSPPAYSTVFRISPAGDYTVVANFHNAPTGNSQGLLQASDGNFYGAGFNGVFRLSPGGTLTTLYLFGTQPNDGSVGNGPLIQATDGNLYGVTANGGTGASGIVFRISLAGDYIKIFDMVRTVEGLSPNGLLQASDGNLYGTTAGAGPPLAGGVVYEITADGTLLRSASLTNATGIGSVAPLIQASDGKLYGTARGSGSGSAAGTVFVVDAGLPPSSAPTISIINIPSNAAYGGSFAPAYAYVGDGITSVTSNTTSICTVSSGVVNFVGVGTCTLVAHATATANYAAATGSPQPFSIAPLTTTISIYNIPSGAMYGGSFTPGYTYTGDGTPSVTSNTTATCTVAGTVVNFVGLGTCTLVAHATAGTNYAAVAGNPQSFAIAQATPAISINNIPSGAVYGGSFTPAYTYTGNGKTSATSNTPSTCTVSNKGLVSYVGVGTCTLVADATATANYAAATGSPQSFTIAQATTTIAIKNLPNTARTGRSFTPTYKYIGDGATSATSNTTGICTVSGGTVSFLATGTCTLVAHATAGSNFAAATGSDQSFTIK